MKYPKTASQFLKVNKEVNTAKINNRLVLVGDFTINYAGLKTAVYESAVENLKKHFRKGTTISDYAFSDFYFEGIHYYLDFNIKKIYVESDLKTEYQILEIADFRLIGYTEMDMYYNKPASIVYTFGNMQNTYRIDRKMITE